MTDLSPMRPFVKVCCFTSAAEARLAMAAIVAQQRRCRTTTLRRVEAILLDARRLADFAAALPAA